MEPLEEERLALVAALDTIDDALANLQRIQAEMAVTLAKLGAAS